jgi:glycosyltransferase involved in cell wall biosynthesis
MKVCVYGICKNEEANVDRFMEGALEADVIVIYDGGSTDKTVEKFKKYDKVIIEQGLDAKPFDFSVARNKALELVPLDVDVCISIDLDESMQKGWRNALEKEWKPDTIQGSYWYLSNFEQKENLISCWRTKIHSRNGFHWERSIHEMIKAEKDGGQVFIKDLVVRHHRTHTVNYESYLNDFIKKNPDNAEVYLQRAGNNMDLKKFKEALEDDLKFLELTYKSNDILTASKRALICVCIAKNLLAMKEEYGRILKYLLQAVAEFPNYRDAWVYLAEFYLGIKDYGNAYGCSMKALSITNNSICVREEKCWGDYPKQIANTSVQKIINKYGGK